MKHFHILRRVAAATALAALTGLAACGETRTQTGFSRPPTPVETATVASGVVADRFTTIGTIEADEAITVTSEINGIVVELPFREGRALEAGALLARLDDAQLRAESQRAEAVRDQMRATFARVQSVVEQGAGSPQDLDDATAALKVAEAELSLARARLDKTRITAPFAGVAGQRQVSPGAFVRAGDAITELVQSDRLRVDFAVPERLLERLQLGAEVTVSTSAFADHTVTGTIDVIAPQLDPTTRNVAVLARLDNHGGLLRPGMSATIGIVLDERAQALTIPSEAVFVTGDQAFVFVVAADSTVVQTAVELGTRQADRIEVVSGLDIGQQVVSAGHQKLYPGARVAPVDGGSAGDGRPAGTGEGR